MPDEKQKKENAQEQTSLLKEEVLINLDTFASMAGISLQRKTRLQHKAAEDNLTEMEFEKWQQIADNL